MKKMWYIHSGILFSHKRECNDTICSNTDGPRDDYTKSATHRKSGSVKISLVCGILKKIQMNLPIKQKQTHRHREQNCGC